MRIMKFGILILVALGIFACANANQETKKSGQASTSKVSAKQSSAAQVSDDLSTHVNDTPAKNQIIKSTSSTDNIKVVTKEKPKPKPTATQSTKPVSQPNTETAVAKKTEETGLIQNIKEKIQEKKEERQEAIGSMPIMHIRSNSSLTIIPLPPSKTSMEVSRGITVG